MFYISRNLFTLMLPYNRRFLRTTNFLYDIFTIQDEQDFKDKVLSSKQPVVVDFFATWCGPCKLLAPKLETVIGSLDGKVHLAKIDVDALESLTLKYNVSSVPSVFGIKDGKIIDHFVGNKDDDELRAFIHKLLDYKS